MKKLLVPFLLCAIAVSSCKKTDDDPSRSSYITYSSLGQAMNSAKPTAKFVNIDAVAGGSVYGNTGTRYFFQPSSFVMADGTPVTGTVQLELTEYLKKGDMIFGRALPLCGDEPLASGGEVYVNATQGGAQVYLAPGRTYQANIPQDGTPVAGMGFFMGTPVTTQDSMNNVAWKPADSIGHGAVTYNGDTITIISDSLHWANADQFLTSPDYQTFTVTFSAAGTTVTDASYIMAFALYDNYKALWPLGYFEPRSGTTYSEHHLPSVPVHFAIFGVVGGKFYGGVLAATPVTGGTYNVLMTEVDPVAFKGQLNNLVH